MTETGPGPEDISHATPTEEDRIIEARASIVRAVPPHVVFDGWSDKTLRGAAEDAGVDHGLARLAFPRGGVDLALAFHYECDRHLAERLDKEDLLGLRFRDKVAHAIALRLEMIQHEREAVRRAASMFALPNYAADGARAIWHTSDTIWTALGDESRDYSWYTKRATLAGVYSSALLYWLGDETPAMEATRAFIRRRIDNVMQFEDLKARVRKNSLASALMRGPARLLDRIQPPKDVVSDLPGSLRRRV